MLLTYPWGLLALSLAIPFVYAFVSTPTKAERTVSTVQFWREASGTAIESAQSQGNRRHNWYLLVLRMIVLGLLVGAMTRPRLAVELDPTVILIDNSISMSAGTAGDTPLDRAKRFALRQSQSGRNLAVMNCSELHPLVAPFTTDARTLSHAIESVEINEFTNIDRAMATARLLASGQPGGKVLLLTDQYPLGKSNAQSIVDVRSFAPRGRDNQAILQFNVRRNLEHPAQVDLFMELANQSNNAVRPSVELALGDTLLDVFEVELGENGRKTINKTYLVPDAGELIAKMVTDDDLDFDNVATTELAGLPELQVTLVGQPNAFLLTALKVQPGLKLDIRETLPDAVSPDSLVVLHRDLPTPLPPCHTLIIDPQIDFEGMKRGAELTDSRVAHMDDSDVVLKDCALVGVDLAANRVLSFSSAYRPLAVNQSGSVLLAKSNDANHLRLVMNANLARSELTRSEAFPVFIGNLVGEIHRLSGRPSELPLDLRRLENRLAESDLRSKQRSDAAAIRLGSDHLRHLWKWLAIAGAIGVILHLLSTRKNYIAIAISVAALLLAAFALTDPAIPHTIAKPIAGPLAIACDVSASIGDLGLTKLAEIQNALDEREYRRFVKFANQVTPSDSMNSAAQGNTDLAAAIRACLDGEPLSEILLVTDGNQTVGDAVYAASSAGVPISVIPVGPAGEADVWIESVQVPDLIWQSEPFSVRVTIGGNNPAVGSLELHSGDKLLDTRSVSLVASGDGYRSEVDFQYTVNAAQPYALQVVASQFGDRHRFNNDRSILLLARPKRQIICVDVEPTTMEPWADAMRSQGFQVNLTTPDMLPSQTEALAKYQTVVLADVSASQLSAEQQSAISDFVAELGGGLVFVGGDRSFALGGYGASSLSRLMPVSCAFERTQQLPQVAMVMVLDRSSSMQNMSLLLAKETIRASLGALHQDNRFGLIAFDAESKWVMPLDDFEQVKSSIQALDVLAAAGGTSFAPALHMAHDGLANEQAPIKHVILLSDGHSIGRDFEQQVSAMRADGITLSTIALGTNADQAMMARLAESGGGRSFFCIEAQAVTEIVAEATARASENALVENRFRPMVIRQGTIPSTTLVEAAPMLHGFVRTSVKPFADVLLATDSGEPLLAINQVGNGRVVAFTADSKARWAKDWLGWPSFGQFWGDLIRWADNTQNGPVSGLSLTRDGERLRAVCVAAEGNFGGWGADFLLANGERVSRDMMRVGSRHYTASLDVDESGPAMVVIGNAERDQASAAVPSAASTELQATTPNLQLLRQLAAISGGRFDPTPDELTLAPAVEVAGSIDLAPWLLLASLTLFVSACFQRGGRSR